MDINTSNLRVTYYARACSDPVLPFDPQDFCAVEYKFFIEEHHNWTYIPGYIDEPDSSEDASRICVNFERMMEDAVEGKFDLVLCDTICNFAKDIPESVRCVRQLLSHGVGVFFTEDNINSLDEDSQLRLSILAAISQA